MLALQCWFCYAAVRLTKWSLWCLHFRGHLDKALVMLPIMWNFCNSHRMTEWLLWFPAFFKKKALWNTFEEMLEEQTCMDHSSRLFSHMSHVTVSTLLYYSFLFMWNIYSPKLLTALLWIHVVEYDTYHLGVCNCKWFLAIQWHRKILRFFLLTVINVHILASSVSVLKGWLSPWFQCHCDT